MTVLDNPVAKGITITGALVDNRMNTSGEEYSGGPVGISLNGVVIFAAMAAPGDDLAAEQFTFDSYEAHPAMTTYHYHFNTPGPLEVLVDRGYSGSSTPGDADIELYGIMCDGTLVLGCTELDGSAPSTADFDAQNGHLHDISAGGTVHFTNRYHTHVCLDQWPDYPSSRRSPTTKRQAVDSQDLGSSYRPHLQLTGRWVGVTCPRVLDHSSREQFL